MGKTLVVMTMVIALAMSTMASALANQLGFPDQPGPNGAPSNEFDILITKNVNGVAPEGEFQFQILCREPGGSNGKAGAGNAGNAGGGYTYVIATVPQGHFCTVFETNSLGADSTSWEHHQHDSNGADVDGTSVTGTGSVTDEFEVVAEMHVVFTNTFDSIPTTPTADDCKKGGWRALGFRNQGLCIASFKADNANGNARFKR